MFRSCAYAALLTTAFCACGAGQRNSAHQNQVLQAHISRLRAEARQQRNRMRDLETQNLKLKQQTDTDTIERRTVGIPDLPVVKKEPEDSSTTTSSSTNKHKNYQVVGVDRNGREIVYMGDATKSDSIRPKITNRLGSSEGTTPPGRRLLPVPKVFERLTVTKNVPTIANQLRNLNPTPPPATTVSPSAEAEYRRYYAALRAGNHAYAITGFRNFIKRHPRHDYADNAQYWLGEAFYDQKHYAKALVEFRRVVTRFASGNKVPDALLKIGYCYTALKQLGKARTAFKRIITVYPRGRPAELASAQLAKLRAN